MSGRIGLHIFNSKKGNHMPSYGEYRIGDKVLTVTPSGVKRGWFSDVPFFNGSYIMFDLVVKMPYKANINEALSLEWRFVDKNNGTLIKNNIINFSYSNIRNVLKVKPREYDYFDNKPFFMKFVKKAAIDIGRRWDLCDYNLIFKEVGNPNEDIVCYITLENKDHFSLAHTLNLISAGYAILGLIVGTIITAFVLKGCGGG